MSSVRNGLYCFLVAICAFVLLIGCGGSSSERKSSTSIAELKSLVDNGETSPNASDRIILVDVRSSAAYIDGHIKDSLSVPMTMISDHGKPLYTNGYNELSTTASQALKDSWLTHMLVNQLVNDFVTTYEHSKIIFYGSTEDEGRQAATMAGQIGYRKATYLKGDFSRWQSAYPTLVERYFRGVESVDEREGSFVMSGYINNTNFENVSRYGTHHGIIYEGGGLRANAFFQVHLSPFGFQEMLTYLGADPSGNMADGIFFGDMSEWASKFTNGQQVRFFVTWLGAERYYPLEELYDERPSFFQPEFPPFVPVGIEARIGGTRESNINWNPGCIFCLYSCVCGITSNAKANENTWFSDGGTYDLTDNPRNFYAGRYYPRVDVLPGAGHPISIKVVIVK